MADIWEAYQFLNKSLKLSLDKESLLRAEAGFMKEFMKKKGFPNSARVTDWEFFAHLTPAKRAKSAAKE